MGYNTQSGINRMEEEAHKILAWEEGRQVFSMDGRLFADNSIPSNGMFSFLSSYLKNRIIGLPKNKLRKWKGVVINGGPDSRQEKDTKDKRRPEYQLVVSKNAGSKIGCDQAVTVFSGIQEQIYEEDGSVIVRMNPGLSSKITFSSPESFVVFSGEAIINNMKAVNFVVNSDEMKKPRSKEITLSVSFNGENGTHKQNIIFGVAGQPYIQLPERNLYIIAASGDRFEFIYTLIDFIGDAKVEVRALQPDAPFDMKADKNIKGQSIISVTDRAQKKKTEEFLDSYPCEIIAFNKSESAKTTFNVVSCREGIPPDFL